MDETELYIKMSDCPEIQSRKEKFEDGDWFAYYDPIAYGKRGKLCVQVVGSVFYSFTREYVKKWHYFSVVGYDEGDCESVWEDKIIWLPCQDDIQRMLIKEKFGDFGAHWDMCIDIPIQFVAKNPDLELSSMEQIWLSCYMLSIHQKIWSSKEEKWVKK